jgi:hypothetical protein
MTDQLEMPRGNLHRSPPLGGLASVYAGLLWQA